VISKIYPDGFLNEFNDGAVTTKFGRLFKVLMTLLVKLNLHRSYLGLWIYSLRSLPLVVTSFVALIRTFSILL